MTGYDIYCRVMIPIEGKCNVLISTIYTVDIFTCNIIYSVQNAIQLQGASGTDGNSICLQLQNGIETMNYIIPKETYTNFSLSWQSLSPDDRIR